MALVEGSGLIEVGAGRAYVLLCNIETVEIIYGIFEIRWGDLRSSGAFFEIIRSSCESFEIVFAHSPRTASMALEATAASHGSA